LRPPKIRFVVSALEEGPMGFRRDRGQLWFGLVYSLSD
jgi:hypothetical protein